MSIIRIKLIEIIVVAVIVVRQLK